MLIIKSPAMASKQQIDQVKKEIRELLPAYHTPRLELGMDLIQLQEMLAHYGNGPFNKVATEELKIPHNILYDLIDYATAEINKLERLSGRHTKKDDDIDVEIHDAEEMVAALREFGRLPVNGRSGFSSLHNFSGDTNESNRQASSIGSLC